MHCARCGIYKKEGRMAARDINPLKKSMGSHLGGLKVSTAMAEARALLFFLLLSSLLGLGMSYTRPPPRKTLSLPFEDDDPASPQQVRPKSTYVSFSRVCFPGPLHGSCTLEKWLQKWVFEFL